MKSESPRTECYIGSFCRPLQEAWLEDRGFGHGMIMFAIPSQGILFKCRAEGRPIDLEFGAFFSLLRFIKTSLSKEKIKAVRVLSSNPEFVFAILNAGKPLKANPQRLKIYRKYLASFDIEVAYVPSRRNKTGVSPIDYPSVPRDATPPLTSPKRGRGRIRLRPIQKGVHL